VLAIIIPAYKPEYLSDTLHSLKNQTCHNFKVYIGNDNSPFDIDSIVSFYAGDLTIMYHKFTENLGATSLVQQWQRCIELSTEPWIWLFSDDDTMAPTCVASFYQQLETENSSHFYKFSTQIIDKNGNVILSKYEKNNLFTENISSEYFISQRLKSNGFRSFAVEYVFSRDLYNRHKFVDFPLAWASDDATWITYAYYNKGITCIDDVVFWRWSGLNITALVNDNTIVEQKMKAAKAFLYWLIIFSQKHDIRIDEEYYLKWLSQQIASHNYISSFKEIKKTIESIPLRANNYQIKKYWIIVNMIRLGRKVKMIFRLMCEYILNVMMGVKNAKNC
jgi:glycosyltransferase involved in cell wall biosynthesis